jgi:hypothetical protein
MEWYETSLPSTLAQSPLSFAWDGPDAHIGPVERQTPLLVALKNKTTCGTWAIAAASATWGFLRFANHLEVSHYLKFAEAVFLQMPDSRMIDISSVKAEVVPPKPAPVSAIKRIRRLLMAAVGPSRWGRTIDQPFRETFHLIHLTRHVLDSDGQKSFDKWLAEAIARIDAVAVRPQEQNRDWSAETPDVLNAYIRLFRGQPIAPTFFSGDQAPEDLAAEFAAFSTEERRSANQYFRRLDD